MNKQLPDCLQRISHTALVFRTLQCAIGATNTSLHDLQGGLPAFEWTDLWGNILHLGQPRTFNFSFELQRPITPASQASS